MEDGAHAVAERQITESLASRGDNVSSDIGAIMDGSSGGAKVEETKEETAVCEATPAAPIGEISSESPSAEGEILPVEEVTQSPSSDADKLTSVEEAG